MLQSVGHLSVTGPVQAQQRSAWWMDGQAAAKNLLIHAQPDVPLTDQLRPRKSAACLTVTG